MFFYALSRKNDRFTTLTQQDILLSSYLLRQPINNPRRFHTHINDTLNCRNQITRISKPTVRVIGDAAILVSFHSLNEAVTRGILSSQANRSMLDAPTKLEFKSIIAGQIIPHLHLSQTL